MHVLLVIEKEPLRRKEIVLKEDDRKRGKGIKNVFQESRVTVGNFEVRLPLES
jgi:hypothetical protein